MSWTKQGVNVGMYFIDRIYSLCAAEINRDKNNVIIIDANYISMIKNVTSFSLQSHVNPNNPFLFFQMNYGY